MNNTAINFQTIAVDFDGTLCYSKWPDCGQPNQPLITYLQEWALPQLSVYYWKIIGKYNMIILINLRRSPMNKLDISTFFPEDMLQITETIQKENAIHIYLKSITRNCNCPKCGQLTEQYHGTYVRTVQDLPILGKTVRLHLRVHEYNCLNNNCDAATFAESFNRFLDPYSRMTERCADFICSLALETSCEGCSRICKVLGMRISGDTVIRLLLKRYQFMEDTPVGDRIGIDDFAYKKRHTYGTVIVDGETHIPITLLDRRDGESLRKWLQNNKHIKVVTRDRASAYAKVIAEELPDAMQIADRFHLHQNLLDTIKKALNHELPAAIRIPHAEGHRESTEPGKKNRT